MTVGDKHEYTPFINIISSYDIVCLSELHTNKVISIPGFTLKRQKIRPKNHKGPKISGGIAVFVKNNIAKNFTIIPNKNIDSIWMKTNYKDNPIHFGFYYCSPGKRSSTFFETVKTYILHYQMKTVIEFS